MGFIVALYANVLLSIADVSARLFAPPPDLWQTRTDDIQEACFVAKSGDRSSYYV